MISLDLRRLNELHSLDEVSGEAELGAGVTGPDAERLLGERGFSLGHFPQSFQFATIGGFAATRSSGQDSAGYGRFNDMVRGLRAVTPAGVLDLGRAPESAAGPDLRQLLIGSEGVFGVITRVRVKVHPVPAATRYEAWSFPDFATGADALRAVVQTGAGPTVIRLSDEAETGVNLATTDREHRHSDGVHDQGADHHQAGRGAELPVPALLREVADDRRGDDEPDEIAAGRTDEVLAATRRLGVDRQPRRPDEDVEEHREGASRRSRAVPTRSTAPVWSVYGTGVHGTLKAICAASAVSAAPPTTSATSRQARRDPFEREEIGERDRPSQDVGRRHRAHRRRF